MRIAVFSDIHAMLPALHSLLHDLGQTQIDAIWCLGDMTGYGMRPDDVVAEIRELLTQDHPHPLNRCLLGNHDQALLEVLRQRCGADLAEDLRVLQHMNTDARTIIEHHSQRFDCVGEDVVWLASLPPMTAFAPDEGLPGVVLAHGHYYPDDPGWSLLGYGASDGAIRQQQAAYLPIAARLLLLGHSHHAALYTLNDLNTPQALDIGQWQALSTEHTTLIDVGSISLPRDERDCPTYIWLDVDADAGWHIQFRRLRYNTGNILQHLTSGYPAERALREQLRRVDKC